MAAPKYETESYVTIMTRLNSELIMGSLGGVYWPHQYLYCMKRNVVHNNVTRLLFFSSQLGTDSGTSLPHNGKMVSYLLSNSNFIAHRSIDPSAIDSSDRYNFMDPSIDINLYNAIPDATEIKYYPGTSMSYDTLMATSVMFNARDLAGTSSGYGASNITNIENGISLIKTMYAADEGNTDNGTYPSRHLKRYIKAIFNTDDPMWERTANEVPITTLVSTDIVIAYNAATPEVPILREMFGTPTNSNENYAKDLYEETLNLICRDIFLSSSTTRRIFLRQGQPNKLTNKDLQYSQKYTEFNTKLVSMLSTRSYMSPGTTSTITTSTPATPTGGLY